MVVVFFGHHSISMDNKGRIIVPLEFRGQMGDRAVITNGPDKCLYMYTVPEWEATAGKIMSLPDMNNPKLREAKRFLFINTSYVDIDKQGRVLVQKRQRDYADIDTGVTFIGMGSKIEIWSDKHFEEPGQDQNMSDVFAGLEEFNI